MLFILNRPLFGKKQGIKAFAFSKSASWLQCCSSARTDSCDCQKQGGKST